MMYIDNGLPKLIVIDGGETFDQNKIAHGFNKFFTDIGPKLASSILSSTKDFKDFSSLDFTFKFRFNSFLKMNN